MSCGNQNILDGTNQNDRLAAALKVDYVSLDERSQEDLLLFFYQLADALAFYNSSNQPEGTFQRLLDGPEEIKELLLLQESEGPLDIPAQKALMLAFTRLFAHAQKELNTLTKRHLDYYYKDILQIKPKSAVPDQVQILFELVKNEKIKEHKVPLLTQLDGGKDTNGNSLIYQTDQEIIVNRASIQKLSTLFVDSDSGKSRIFAAPVANSVDGLGTAFETEESYWPTFGERQVPKPLESRNMIDANIGFAVSSPILILNEGARTVKLNFKFKALELVGDFLPDTLLQQSFTILCSGNEGWFEPLSYSSLLEQNDNWNLTIELTIGLEQPPLSFFNSEIHEDSFDTPWPTIKFSLKPKALGYDTLRNFQVDSVEIDVEAKDVKSLTLQNDQGVIDGSKPFFPFGSAPAIGSSFIIGNKEVFQKKLNYLALNLEWHDIPEADLRNYYQAYYSDPLNEINNTSFEARIEQLYNRKWDNLLKPLVTLFDTLNAETPLKIEIDSIEFDSLSNQIDYRREPSLNPDAPYGLSSSRDFIRLKLTLPIFPIKAFGHKEFPKIYAEKAISLAKYDENATPSVPEPILPNPPYTPSIKALNLCYRSSETIYPADDEYDKLYQLAPFGHTQITTATPQLLTQCNNEGELYLGLNQLEVPKTINFLFHFEEGSANSDVELILENVSWSYLSENKWIGLGSNEVLFNSTEGYLTSGIITVVVPTNATNQNNLMPKELYWLKIGTKDGAEGASKLRNIFTNAATASLITDTRELNNYDDHLASPLPAETIKNLIAKSANIKKVVQPFNSINGQPTELENPYYTRVSERLRHKQRAIQNWDYERIVLDKFPDIFKVKSLAHTNPNTNLANGDVTLVVVSNLRNANAANPFEPRTGRVILNRIEAYVHNYISPFIKLYVENPVYESILVDVKIGFKEGFDPGYYSGQLNEELKQFLSPWAFEDGKDIVIGGRIYKSTILLFLESREYVDYVVDLKLYHIYDGEIPGGISDMEINYDFLVAFQPKPAISEMTIGTDFIVGQDVQVACATTPRSIIVTHPNHRIKALRPDELSCPGSSNLGIGFMTVNIDFIVDKS